jgi:hypothetical protein
MLWMLPHSTLPTASHQVAIAHPTAPPLPPVASTASETAPPPAQSARSRQEFVAKKPLVPPPPPPPAVNAPAPSPPGMIGRITAGTAAQPAQPAAKQAAPTVASGQPQIALAESGAAPQGTPAPSAGSAAPAQQAQRTVATKRAVPPAQPASPAASQVAAGALTSGLAVRGYLASSDALHLTIEHNQGPDNGLSAINGTVTDLSGAVISHASITLRSSTSGTTSATTTDDHGGFALPTVAPGQYELQISAPGFLTDTERLDLQARDVAQLSPALRVGAASTTVEVVNEENASLDASSVPTDAQLDAIVPVLPGKLPAATKAVKNGRILALDTAGTLYLSRDAGRHWKKIRPAWTGAIAHLVVAPGASSSALQMGEIAGTAHPLFEITTTDGAIWISNDGAHWRLR